MNNLTYKSLMVGLFVLLLVQKPVHSQCNPNGIDVTLKPTTPIQFQFFPMGLLGIGTSGSAGTIESFGGFGVQLNLLPSASPRPQYVIIKVELYLGNSPLFSVAPKCTLRVPNTGVNYFVSVPQFINGSISPALSPIGYRSAKISQAYADQLAGGMPSGNFRFEIITAAADTIGQIIQQTSTFVSCGSIEAEVLAGATVDLIVPSNNAETSNLPFFQWAAIGGDKFVLTIAKVKTGQSFINALGTSSQRSIIELMNTRSYQATAGGPAGARENNLTWNPGLIPGQYCYQITMIQTDPITGSQNLVPSAIYSFVVAGTGKENLSGLNTQEIINILSSKLTGFDLDGTFKGYNAVSLEINGTTATVEDLRSKVNNLPKAFKVEIKP